MATLEQSPATERSLMPEASRRIILKLVSTDPSQPLPFEWAIKLNTQLHKDKDKKQKATSSVVYAEGNYYVDFTEKQHDVDPLTYAVTETDTALLDSTIPAEVQEAWVAPVGGPSVEQLTPEAWQSMDSQSGAARNIFHQHHDAAAEEAFTRLLFSAA